MDSVELDTLLESFRGWLVSVSRRMTLGKGNTHADWQDVAQEGHIAMWRAAQDWDGRGTREGWMKYKAQGAMFNSLRTRLMSELPYEHTHEDSGRELDVWTGLFGFDNLDAVETAYHAGEIMDALCELSTHQREYIYRKFWLGQTYKEISEAMHSSNPSTLWSAKQYGARDKLRKSLKHLADASV